VDGVPLGFPPVDGLRHDPPLWVDDESGYGNVSLAVGRAYVVAVTVHEEGQGPAHEGFICGDVGGLWQASTNNGH